jgi:hypothetical protein
MTLDELTYALGKADPKVPLIFDGPSGRSAPGYHVTEFKRAHVDAIDCAGRRDSWQEARLQILDGQGREHMPVEKFLAIARHSRTAFPDLGAGELKVEFSAGNDRLELLDPLPPRIDEAAVIVPLGRQRATCKPAEDMRCASC